MELIKLNGQHTISCPYCKKRLRNNRIIWEGIHICGTYSCNKCRRSYVSPLPVGHTSVYPFIIEPSENKIFGDRNDAYYWLGRPLLFSLCKPNSEDVPFERIYFGRKRANKTVVFTNCIDYLYGHCLLKLFSVEQFKREKSRRNYYLIVLIPRCITWLVPHYVDEIWVVDIDITKAQKYYLTLEEKIRKAIGSFHTVLVNPAPPHPSGIHIEDFSKISPLQTSSDYSIAFYWRTDRAWVDKKHSPFQLAVQYLKIIYLFYLLKRSLKLSRFSVVGVGTQYRFPSWIQDYRIAGFDQVEEEKMCRRYSKFALVIGVLGSHLILPAAHARSTVELVPHYKWDNMGQNIINPSHQSVYDFRFRQFLHRFVPIDIRVTTLAALITSLLLDQQNTEKYFPSQIIR